MLALPVAYASIMTTADYKAGKSRIAAGYQADKAECAELRGSPRQLCREVAMGKQRVARAELDYIYTGKPADRDHAPLMKAKSEHAVAVERCADRIGDDKALCIRAANAALTRALSDARTVRRTDAFDHGGVRAVSKSGAAPQDTLQMCVGEQTWFSTFG